MSDDCEELPLQNLVLASTCILLVSEGQPFRVPQVLHRDGCSPFETVQLHYIVDECLSCIDDLQPGDAIVVNIADLDYRWQLHCQSDMGFNEFPIFNTYQPSPEVHEQSRYIVFLRRLGQGYEFAADQAYESVAYMDEINALIAKREEQLASLSLPDFPASD